MTAQAEATTPQEAAVKAARAAYQKAQVQVDRDLAVERERRLAEPRRALAQALAEARNNGSKMTKLMALYGTKDYRTVRNLLDEASRSRYSTVDPVTGNWFTVTDEGEGVDIGNIKFYIVQMEGGSIMLSTLALEFPNGYDADPDPIVQEYDGLILPDEAKTEAHFELVAALGLNK